MPHNYLDVYSSQIYWNHRPAEDHSLKINTDINQDMTLGIIRRFYVGELVFFPTSLLSSSAYY